MKIDVNNIYRLKGVVQHYAWGGFEFIPNLLGVSNTSKQPYAEYWMGAHQSAPSLLVNGEDLYKLNEVFYRHPILLSKEVYDKFHQLPYLFKILDVREMLSIQVHPTQNEAELGFHKEDEKGVDINAPNRNYKDKNHKPELMIALSEFWLLHGFRSQEQILDTLQSIAQFRSLVPTFEKLGTRGLYNHLMNLPQHEVDMILQPLVQKEVRRRSYNELDRDEPGYWAGEYYLNKEVNNIDRGIFSIYLFNLVHLQPGEGIYQGAGIPHAYLKGQNVELMANSDNVLRGGLTNKHIDVQELMKHTSFDHVIPNILTGEHCKHETAFYGAADDFSVSRIELPNGQRYTTKTTSPEILICMEGAGDITSGNKINFKKGDVFIAFAGNEYTIEVDGNTILYKASVPKGEYQQLG